MPVPGCSSSRGCGLHEGEACMLRLSCHVLGVRRWRRLGLLSQSGSERQSALFHTRMQNRGLTRKDGRPRSTASCLQGMESCQGSQRERLLNQRCRAWSTAGRLAAPPWPSRADAASATGARRGSHATGLHRALTRRNVVVGRVHQPRLFGMVVAAKEVALCEAHGSGGVPRGLQARRCHGQTASTRDLHATARGQHMQLHALQRGPAIASSVEQRRTRATGHVARGHGDVFVPAQIGARAAQRWAAVQGQR